MLDPMAVQQTAPMVGRAESLREAREALRRAADGLPGVVLVTGETGVGKTRLVRELLRDEATIPLVGACVPVAGEPLPFAPLTQALRRLRHQGPLRQVADRSPALARLLPGVDAERAPESGPPNQLALFQSVLELLGRLGAAGAVLHVVEDVHWADRSTLDLLHYLAVNLSHERVVLLATYRADAVEPGSTLARWLAEVGRLETTRRIELDRLGADETTRLATELAGGPIDADLLGSVLSRSAGNPLFVEHLVLQGSGSRDTLPTTLRELLESRVDALPQECQTLLGAMSVLGRAASTTAVAAVLSRSVDDLEPALRSAIEQHVAEIRPDERIGFRHPAFREVVYARLLPGERTRLHAAAAAVLGERHDPRHAGELARHWLRAGDLPRALDAAVVAGGAAEEMFAFAEAHTNFARAADLALRVPSDHDRVTLLTRAADAAAFVGDSDEAVRLAEAALREAADDRTRAGLAERLGTIHYLAGRGEEAERCYRRALELLPDGDVSDLAARVHAGIAGFSAAWSRVEDARRHGEAGLQIAERAGARREEGRLHNALGVAASTSGDHEEGAAHLRTALDVARDLGEGYDLATAYVNLTHVLILAGRLSEAIDVGRDGIEALGRIGFGRQIGSVLRANTCEALISAGRFAEAQELLAETPALHTRGIMASPVLLQEARLALVLGDLDEAWERCEQARVLVEAESAPDAWRRSVHELAATIELWKGRPGAAYDQVVDGLHLIRGTDEARFGGALAALGMRALADEVEARRDAATRSGLASRIGELDAAAGRARGAAADPATALWFAAERSRTGLRSDPVAWATVREAWARVGMPFEALYARWREAEARLDGGSDAAGIDALRAAHEEAARLGVQRVVEEVRNLARWHRIDLPQPVRPGPGEPSGGASAGAEEAPDGNTAAVAAYGLTERELEVLGALAAGRTNREIADELFISVKTASVHVSNILRKLEVSGRQEAARVAHRLGVRGPG